jgi:mono/diheme cytochrome c family protein
MTPRFAFSMVLVTHCVLACSPQAPNPGVTPQDPEISMLMAGHAEPDAAGSGGHAAGTSGNPPSMLVSPNVVPPPVVQPPSMTPPTTAPDPAVCIVGCNPALSPELRPVTQAARVPPPVSGGTLLATKDGKWLIAADPDRDRLYFVAVTSHELAHVRELEPGDEPGRMVEDAAGRIHVALRSGHALLSLTPAADSPLTRRSVCALPRGLAYDATQDQIHVACAEGQLVSVAAEPDGAVRRKVELGRDLRDVIVRGDDIMVTRFRSAELLRLDASGNVQQRLLPPAVKVPSMPNPMTGATLPESMDTPNTVWRAIDVPGKGSALLHQVAREGVVQTTLGGYGSAGCSGIVHTAVTVGLDGLRTVSANIADATLAVDMAIDASGSLLAVVSPGNWGSSIAQLSMYSLTGLSPLNPLAPIELTGVVTQSITTILDRVCLTSRTRYPSPDGQVTAVSFVGTDELAAFEREPAAISFLDVRSGRGIARVDLGQPTRYDTGHALFHMRSASGLACGSCHPEAGDDSHVWTFDVIGPRRTQNLRGGILGTEPLHWDGDMKDFGALLDDVFVKRMRGPMVGSEHGTALARFIDSQPVLAAPARDAEAATRGQALFRSDTVGCSSCHAGKLLTDNHSADVGTGSVLQVPALRGVSFRLPLMHNGCASTLRQRFEVACGGGEMHGHTQKLSAAQVDDLIAYLETL